VARAWLSLGSNQDPQRHLAAAIAELRARFGALILSPTYESAAVGFDGPPFWNLAAGLDPGDLDPVALDAWLHALEDRQGRRREVPRFSSRTLDVDLLLYGDRVLRGPGNLQLPRPELAEQAFVLRPMVDIAAELLHPTLGRTLADLWREFERPDALKPVPVPWLAAAGNRDGGR
jgi:2-amino-4-hydroxy-6-hydroxymethyldihydropteridine diphosphokinase